MDTLNLSIVDIEQRYQPCFDRIIEIAVLRISEATGGGISTLVDPERTISYHIGPLQVLLQGVHKAPFSGH